MIIYESLQCLVSDCSECEGCIPPTKTQYEIDMADNISEYLYQEI